jgi:hypothetical protein
VTDSPDARESAESPELAEVRRLLADARHDEPMPDDVVTRMNHVIAGLRDAPNGAAEPTVTPAEGADNVVPLAAHRRRRAAGMLVAAAAIVVGGVVLAQHHPSTTSSETAGSAAAQDDGEPSRSPGKSAGPRSQAGKDLARGRFNSTSPVSSDGRLLIRPRRFSEDALVGRRLLRRSVPDALSPLEFLSCAKVPADDGVVVPATYQRAPAALVYRPASGGSQVVDLYVCGNGRPVRTVTLPAR